LPEFGRICPPEERTIAFLWLDAWPGANVRKRRFGA
jgi:hypothetical protein